MCVEACEAGSREDHLVVSLFVDEEEPLIDPEELLIDTQAAVPPPSSIRAAMKNLKPACKISKTATSTGEGMGVSSFAMNRAVYTPDGSLSALQAASQEKRAPPPKCDNTALTVHISHSHPLPAPGQSTWSWSFVPGEDLRRQQFVINCAEFAHLGTVLYFSLHPATGGSGSSDDAPPQEGEASLDKPMVRVNNLDTLVQVDLKSKAEKKKAIFASLGITKATKQPKSKKRGGGGTGASGLHQRTTLASAQQPLDGTHAHIQPPSPPSSSSRPLRAPRPLDETCKARAVVQRVSGLAPTYSRMSEAIQGGGDRAHELYLLFKWVFQEQLVHDSKMKKRPLQSLLAPHVDREATNEESLTYGEIKLHSFWDLLLCAARIFGEHNSRSDNLVFYDLGSGRGKAVVAAALCAPWLHIVKCVGVELLPEHCQSCTMILQRLQAQLHRMLEDTIRGDGHSGEGWNEHTHFQEGLQTIHDSIAAADTRVDEANLLHTDFSDGHLVFINSVCFGQDLLAKIAEKLHHLRVGSVVITLNFDPLAFSFAATGGGDHQSGAPPPQKLELVSKAVCDMTWGYATAYIFKCTK
jgi:hypothetical protein